MSSTSANSLGRVMQPTLHPLPLRLRSGLHTHWLLAGYLLATTPAAAQEGWSEAAQQRLAAAVAQATGPEPATGAEADSPGALAVVFDARELLQTGIALGTEELQVPTALLAQADARLRSIAEAARTDQPLAVRAAALLAALRMEFLAGEFQPNCPGLCATLLCGDYNCLTAATLYLLAAERAGLQGQLYERPGHVWCLVRDGQHQCQVETLAVDGVQSVAGVPPGQPLSRRQVLARLYYNAALSALHAGAFDSSLRLSDVALRLDATYPPAWHNLAAALNNWAVELAHAGRSAAALALLQAGTTLLPAEQDLQRNLAALQVQLSAAAIWRLHGDDRAPQRTD